MRSVSMALMYLAMLGACGVADKQATTVVDKIGEASTKPRYTAAWCTALLESRPKGTSITALFNQIKATSTEKREFETTSDYRERQRTVIEAQKAYLARTTGSEYVAIVVSLPIANQKYDADSSVLRIDTGPSGKGLFASSVSFEMDEQKKADFELVPLQVINQMRGNYVGSNSYGASRRVDEVRSEEYGIAVASEPLSQRGYLVIKGGIELPLSAARAAALKGKIGVLIVGELTPPGIIEGRKSFSPTFTNPSDVEVRKRFVAIHSPCAAIIALDTREVLRRLD